MRAREKLVLSIWRRKICIFFSSYNGREITYVCDFPPLWNLPFELLIPDHFTAGGTVRFTVLIREIKLDEPVIIEVLCHSFQLRADIIVIFNLIIYCNNYTSNFLLFFFFREVNKHFLSRTNIEMLLNSPYLIIMNLSLPPNIDKSCKIMCINQFCIRMNNHNI